MKNKKIIILIILILISILTLIGSSYALLSKTFTSKKLSVEVGTFLMNEILGNKDRIRIEEGAIITLGATTLILRATEK